MEPPKNGYPDLTESDNTHRVIRQWLSRARVHGGSVSLYEAVLADISGCRSEQTGYLPMAALERHCQGTAQAALSCVKADPVFLQVDRDQVRLAQGVELALTEGESSELAATINEHFASDGIELIVDHSDIDSVRWYLMGEPCAAVDMQPPMFAAGRVINHFAPRGADARFWKQFLTEVQMLLHAHPVNEKRLARGQQPVNSLWLWGGGELPQAATAPFSGIISTAAIAHALGHYLQRPVVAPGDLDSAITDNAQLLVIDESLYRSTVDNDASAWQDALASLERWCLQPLMTALKSGQLRELTLYPCTGQRYSINCWDLLKFWRRCRPLTAFSDGPAEAAWPR